MKLRSLWLALVLLTVLALAALPTLLYPFTRDQGAYAYIADLMMKGGVPYRDVWDLKPPAIYFVYWVAFALFGRSEVAVRFLDVLYALLSAVSIYVLAREVFGDRRIASLSAWLYAFCYYLLVRFYAVGNPESFMVPFLVAAVWGMVRGLRCRSRLGMLVSGTAGGFALWLKPTAGVVVLAAVACTAFEMRRAGWSTRRVIDALGLVILGGLLGLLPIGLYLWGHGLGELLQLWRQYGSGAYLGARGLALGEGVLAKLDVIIGYLREWQLLVWLSAAGAIAVLLRRQRAHGTQELPPYAAGGTVVVFLLASIAVVLIQGKLFEYHWIPALAPAAILSAASLVWLGEELRGTVSPQGRRGLDMRTILAVVAIAGLLLWLGYDNLARYRRLASYLRGRMGAEQYYAQFDIGRDFSHAATLAAATYLREHTGPDETVLIWGAEPLVNFLAERRSPTKYVFSYMLSDADSGSGLGARRQDFLSEVQQSPPAYCVLVDNDVNPLTPLGSRVLLEGFPAFQEWLWSQYSPETRIEDYSLYRRK
jgi:4-amino-4-deoxy-L-arabinose transferase-like glycosyltransferase